MSATIIKMDQLISNAYNRITHIQLMIYLKDEANKKHSPQSAHIVNFLFTSLVDLKIDLMLIVLISHHAVTSVDLICFYDL